MESRATWAPEHVVDASVAAPGGLIGPGMFEGRHAHHQGHAERGQGHARQHLQRWVDRGGRPAEAVRQ
jgi:hypothetical protein